MHIACSPRKARSHSTKLAEAFITAYAASHPADNVDTFNVWDFDLPEFDGETINAKYAVIHGLEHIGDQVQAWDRVKNVFNRFNAADKYLFSVPMWNFNIPYKLKHFIDVITQPSLSWSFSPEAGYKGLVTGKPAAAIYSSGGTYESGSATQALDLQKPYLETWLRFIGFTEIHSIVVAPTLATPEAVEQAESSAKLAAQKIAESL